MSALRDRKRFWWRIWVENGRPRSGVVYDCYKGSKKLFRKVSRLLLTSFLENNFSKVNQLFNQGNLRKFWKMIKKTKKVKTNGLTVDSLAEHFEHVMTEKGTLTDEQRSIADTVNRKAAQVNSRLSSVQVYPRVIASLIDKLNAHCSPGIDGITSENLKFGKSPILCSILAQVFFRCLVVSCCTNFVYWWSDYTNIQKTISESK